MAVTIHHAEALEWLKTQPDNSFDAFFADPPYGLSPDGRSRTWDDIEAMRDGKSHRGFMGKSWDAGVPGPTFWREVLRVLKPGAPILAFGGTRTYHRMACALEDAGAEISDMVSYNYGSGFPKSYNISIGIDSAAGAIREVVGLKGGRNAYAYTEESNRSGGIMGAPGKPGSNSSVTASTTPEAIAWDGYGTALKPSIEPCVVANKTFDGTIVANILKWGVGGLWIDGCRIGYASDADKETMSAGVEAIRERGGAVKGSWKNSSDLAGANPASSLGRWPANTIFDEEAAAMLDEQSGDRPGMSGGGNHSSEYAGGMFGGIDCSHTARRDSGGASRFFFCAKPSRFERDFGCDDIRVKTTKECIGRNANTLGAQSPRAGAGRQSTEVRNNHPCLKPISLNEHFARLILPPPRTDGAPRRLLNVFAGSGSEAIGAARAGWDEVVCVEREAEYIPILEARIARWSKVPPGMSVDDVRKTSQTVDQRQTSLFDLSGSK